MPIWNPWKGCHRKSDVNNFNCLHKEDVDNYISIIINLVKYFR